MDVSQRPIETFEELQGLGVVKDLFIVVNYILNRENFLGSVEEITKTIESYDRLRLYFK